MKQTLLIAFLLGMVMMAAVPAQQHEMVEAVGARRVTTIWENAEQPLFRIDRFQLADGGYRIYLKGVKETEFIAAVLAGQLTAEDDDGNALSIQVMRECQCKDGLTVRAAVNSDDCQCRTECTEHDGQKTDKLFIRAPIGNKIGFCIDEKILVLIGG